MQKFKAHGQRGSWFADAGGESLPCVHAHWWKSSGYYDPHARPGDPKFEQLVHGIREKGRVIVTKDDVSKDERSFKRTGYVGIFEVDGLQFNEDGLHFRFTGKTADLI